MKPYTKYTITRDKKSKKYIFNLLWWDGWLTPDVLEDLLDPHRNRRMGRLWMWKFNKKEEAEALIFLAILKGIL